MDVAPLGLDDDLVRVAILQRKSAIPAGPAPTDLAEQRGRERPRGELLAAALRPREHVRLVRSRRRLAQERHRVLLARHAVQDRERVLAGSVTPVLLPLLQDPAERLDHLLVDLLGRPVGVDDDEPLRVLLRDP